MKKLFAIIAVCLVLVSCEQIPQPPQPISEWDRIKIEGEYLHRLCQQLDTEEKVAEGVTLSHLLYMHIRLNDELIKGNNRALEILDEKERQR